MPRLTPRLGRGFQSILDDLQKKQKSGQNEELYIVIYGRILCHFFLRQSVGGKLLAKKRHSIRGLLQYPALLNVKFSCIDNTLALPKHLSQSRPTRGFSI